MASFKKKKTHSAKVQLSTMSSTQLLPSSDPNNAAETPPAYFNDAAALGRLQLSRTRRMQRAYTHANIATLVRWLLNFGMFSITTMCVVELQGNQTVANVSKYGFVSSLALFPAIGVMARNPRSATCLLPSYKYCFFLVFTTLIVLGQAATGMYLAISLRSHANETDLDSISFLCPGDVEVPCHPPTEEAVAYGKGLEWMGLALGNACLAVYSCVWIGLLAFVQPVTEDVERLQELFGDRSVKRTGVRAWFGDVLRGGRHVERLRAMSS